jgi:CheY-like chemotaxis protein
MKQSSKQQPGSSFSVDVRADQDRQVAAERRGSRLPTALLISADAPLRNLLQTALKGASYRTLEAPGVLEANALLAHEHDLALIVADARLGHALWELADVLRVEMPDVPLIVLATRPEDEEISFDHGARAVIQQPFQTQQFLACVAQFARHGD